MDNGETAILAPVHDEHQVTVTTAEEAAEAGPHYMMSKRTEVILRFFHTLDCLLSIV